MSNGEGPKRGVSPPPRLPRRREEWDEHEQPTRPAQGPTPGAAFPSEGPTQPKAPQISTRRQARSAEPASQGTGSARDFDLRNPSQRVTAPPPGLSAPIRRKDVVTDPAPPESDSPPEDIFDRPTLDIVEEASQLLEGGFAPERSPIPSLPTEALFHPSQKPTAAPPGELEIDLRNVKHMPRQGSVDRFFSVLDPGDPRTPPRSRSPARPASRDTATAPEPHRPSQRPSQAPGVVGSVRPAGLLRQDRSLGREMHDRFAMGDFSGALEKANAVLATDPLDRDARAMAEKCEEVLLDMYTSRVAGLSRIPHTVMTPDQIRWLSLDHRAGFLLSMMDGSSSVEDILDISGMARLEALRVICSLLDQKVIALI